MTEHSRPDPMQVERLLCAIEPTRAERVATWICGWAWRINDERGPFNWLGDRADDYRVHSWRRRARKRLWVKNKRRAR